MKLNDWIAPVALFLIVSIAILGQTDRPFFLGALTSFTQTGNELRVTEDMVVNGTATITRYLNLQHGNVSNAYLDVFATPTIDSLYISVDGVVVNRLVNDTMVNVARIDFTEKARAKSCDNGCYMDFTFETDDVGSIIVVELNVDYLGDPTPETTPPPTTTQTQPEPDPEPEQQLVTTSQSSQTEQKYLFYAVVILIVFLVWNIMRKKSR